MNTNDSEIMKKLGINPGQVDEYNTVSLLPVSFDAGSDLGWGREWRAQHSAILNISPSRGPIEVEGHGITVRAGKSERFADLLKIWKSEHAIAEPVGRPRNLKGGKTVSMYLDDESLKRARSLGQGNVSEGIRIALSNQTPSDTE
jgi:hypothetical protein